MKIYIMTDLEGVAGVLDFENWCEPSSRYYDLGKEFLTEEVNAAVRGFFDAGATEITVSDGHGWGALDPKTIDPRVELARGWPTGYPCGIDSSCFGIAWVGQHAKAGTPYAHIAHTQHFDHLDLSVNGISIGEFGQVALCANELGVRSIFGSGDLAFTKEAQALFPGIETVAVKRGVNPNTGDDLPFEAYGRSNYGAVHVPPVRAREMIYQGAFRSLKRAQEEDFGLIEMRPPYERVTIFRPDATRPRREEKSTHETSFIGLMNTPYSVR